MIIAEWSRIGKGLYHADAQKVADEIMSIGDDATPHQIVEKATDKSTELHKCFTWDNAEAADKWRLHQARHIVTCLVIHQERKPQDMLEIRVFYKNDDGGYKPSAHIFTQADEHAKLLQTAYAELAAFKRKYAGLQELDYILHLIN